MNIRTKFENDDYKGDAVYLVSVSGSERSIFNAARVSRGAHPFGTNDFTNERVCQLIKTCYQQKHGTPFEFASMTFDLQLPLFVRSQIERYRHCSFVEKSFRTCEPCLADFFIPDCEGSGRTPDEVENLRKCYKNAIINDLENYNNLRTCGEAKERARTVLGQLLRTEVIMTTNVRELLHIFDERLHPTAQRETRIFVQEMFNHFQKSFPFIARLFVEGRSQK